MTTGLCDPPEGGIIDAMGLLMRHFGGIDGGGGGGNDNIWRTGGTSLLQPPPPPPMYHHSCGCPMRGRRQQCVGNREKHPGQTKVPRLSGILAHGVGRSHSCVLYKCAAPLHGLSAPAGLDETSRACTTSLVVGDGVLLLGPHDVNGGVALALYMEAAR